MPRMNLECAFYAYLKTTFRFVLLKLSGLLQTGGGLAKRTNNTWTAG